jgi:hypothetical protein
MTRSRIICRALVALAALSSSTPAFAEEGDPETPAADPQESVEEVIGTLPADQQQAVEGAIEEAETPGGTKVIVVPAPEAKARPYDPTEETDQEAEAEERVPGEKLHPKGEDEMMGSHPVDRGDISFRPGKGVEINSADDDFQLRIRVRVQFLFTVLSGEVGPKEADEPDEVTNNFRIRRARFVFQGHAFGKHNQYKLEIDPLRDDNVVLDYYLDFTKKRDIQVRVGQYKISSNRQRVISSGNLQMVDRSIVNAEFTLDRDIGVDIRSRDFLGKDRMRYVLGISAGNGLNNHKQFTDFSMVYLARFEYLPLGIFRDMSEVDFARTKPRLAIGVTYSYFQGANRARGMIGAPFADGGTANYHFAYVDAIFKARGFSAVTELMFREGFRKNIGDNTEPPDCDPATDPMCMLATPTAARNGIGWTLQAGYLIPNTRFEFAARGSLIRAISSRRPTSLSDRYGTTFSVSWYFARHPFKIQADVSQIWNADQELYKDGATTFRLQLQASL